MNPLESLVSIKVKPLLEDAMHRNLGVTITEIESDISDKLKRGSLWEFDIDTGLKFKEAKRKFKREYIARLLQLHGGNVADVAKAADVDRRSVHRFVAEMRLKVDELRENALRREYAKEVAVTDLIQGALEQYKGALNPAKYERLYNEAPQLSRNIARELPESPKTLKEAEREFERRYVEKALVEHGGNISKTARKIGLRFETLHRKIKGLGLQ